MKAFHAAGRGSGCRNVIGMVSIIVGVKAEIRRVSLISS